MRGRHGPLRPQDAVGALTELRCPGAVFAGPFRRSPGKSVGDLAGHERQSLVLVVDGVGGQDDRSPHAAALQRAGLVVGDAQGYLHVLSKDNGDTLSRISLDGSALAGAPVLAANTLVVVTAKGLVAGLRPGN